MKQQVSLNKEVYLKPQYERTINTSFTQLGVTTQADAPVLPTVDEFFQYYTELFYQIPKEGATNSHQYLVEQSSAYIGQQQQLEEIKALQEEITELRTQLLESRNDAINTIADVLDSTDLNLPALPEIPNIPIPSEFNINTSTESTNPQEEKTRREKRQERRAARRQRREERRNN
jgi:hypothetical protein